jgi:hypothetical protein
MATQCSLSSVFAFVNKIYLNKHTMCSFYENAKYKKVTCHYPII